MLADRKLALVALGTEHAADGGTHITGWRRHDGSFHWFSLVIVYLRSDTHASCQICDCAGIKNEI
jgi:hypothetical protein